MIKTLELSISMLVSCDDDDNYQQSQSFVMDESGYLVNLIVQYICLTKRWMHSGSVFHSFIHSFIY